MGLGKTRAHTRIRGKKAAGRTDHGSRAIRRREQRERHWKRQRDALNQQAAEAFASVDMRPRLRKVGSDGNKKTLRPLV